MLIKALSGFCSDGVCLGKGDTLEILESRAEKLIKKGFVEVVDDPEKTEELRMRGAMHVRLLKGVLLENDHINTTKLYGEGTRLLVPEDKGEEYIRQGIAEKIED